MMNRLRIACFALACAWVAGGALAQEAVRPEVGKPLQAAQELIKAHKYKEALAKIHEADAVGNKTPNETFLIERMRGSAAAQAGENDVAIHAFETVIASGKLPKPEQLKMMEAVASMYYRNKEYAKASAVANRYLKEGGTDSSMRTILIQSQFLTGDCTNAVREVRSEVESQDQAGQAPSEDRLQLLANCYSKQKDNTGYVWALEKLVTYYPKKDYWVDLIRRVQGKRGFSDRFSLDVERIKFATGNMGSAGDYMEMTQLALQAGHSGEAKKVIDQGFSTGALGTGPEAERQKRLRDLAAKTAADDQANLSKAEAEASASKEGTGLVNVGWEYVTRGKADKGLPLMEQGVHKGGLKHPEDEKLHLGIAYLMAGNKAKGTQVLRTVQGNDGSADVARLWVLQSRRG